MDNLLKKIEAMRKAFDTLSRGPQSFAKQVKDLNDQLERLNKNLGGAVGTQVQEGGLTKLSKMLMGAGTGAGTGGPGGVVGALTSGAGMGGSQATLVMAIGSAVQKGMSAVFNRVNSGADTTAATDVYFSRMAASMGTTGQGVFGQFNRQGLPLQGTITDQAQALYNFSQSGFQVGGPGLAGQRGGAAITSAQTLQALAPGMSAQQAGGMLTNYTSNVAGFKAGQAALGQAAIPYTAGGQLKSINMIFDDVLKVLQTKRTGAKYGQPYTKEELILARTPGSNVSSWLSQTGWDDQMISAFFDYSIAKTAYGGSDQFTGTEKQMERVRGQSVAREYQETQTAQAQVDTQYGAQHYKDIISQQDANQKLIDAMGSLEDALRGAFGVAAKLPKGAQKPVTGAVKGAAMGLTAGAILGPETFGLGTLAFGAGGALLGGMGLLGDVGDIGDPGVGSMGMLNPSLSPRVKAMMRANPALSVTSGYRTAGEQKRLWDAGGRNIARPGSSRHGRGQAADIGPASQYPWIMANAKRFGLDHGAKYGEPWHVQVAGSMIGDPMTSADAADQWRQSAFATGRALALANLYAGASKKAGTTPAGAGGATPAATTGASVPSTGTTKGAVSVDTVVQALYSAGFRGQDLIDMAAIPSRESPGYITDAHNPNAKTGDDSYGLWQINLYKGGWTPTLQTVTGSTDPSQLYDPNVSAKVAFAMYQASGNKLTPWGGYKGMSNTYNVSQQAIDDAQAAAAKLYPAGYGDVGGFTGGGGGGSTSVSSNPMVFNNNFSVNVSGNRSLDVDSFVNQIASKLEAQMRRKTALVSR
jgi:hypothetical protein